MDDKGHRILARSLLRVAFTAGLSALCLSLLFAGMILISDGKYGDLRMRDFFFPWVVIEACIFALYIAIIGPPVVILLRGMSPFIRAIGAFCLAVLGVIVWSIVPIPTLFLSILFLYGPALHIWLVSGGLALVIAVLGGRKAEQERALARINRLAAAVFFVLITPVCSVGALLLIVAIEGLQYRGG